MDQLLKKKGIRVTEFRTQVLGVFQDTNSAIDLETIEENLGKFDRITLYRTIKTFLERGLIHEINLTGVKKYALCDTECGDDHVHHHVHFHCKACKEVFCVDVEELPNIKIPDHQVDQIEVQLMGTCSQCKKSMN